MEKEHDALALHNSKHNGLSNCTGTDTQRINTTYSAGPLKRVKMWADMQTDRTNQSQLVLTAAGRDLLGGRVCVHEHVMQSRLSMGVESTHA